MEGLTIDEAITYHNKVAHQQIKNGLRSQNDIYGFLQCAKEHKQHAEWLEKLKDYEDLEEQGRLVKLPCKVGDVVYLIKNNGTIAECVADMMFFGVLWEEFGKEWFVAKSEAEAKLKELRGGTDE